MPDGGSLRITTTEQVHNNHSALVIDIIDSGKGIPPEITDRIFDPFFTTKSAGKGTGLGLASCLMAIEGFGGTLTLHQTSEAGTTFRCTLHTQTDTSDEIKEPSADTPLHLAGLKVLIVDDNFHSRDSLGTILQEEQCATWLCPDAETAQIKINQGLQPDVIILDILLPGMSGIEFATWLLSINPRIPVICISGFNPLQENSSPAELPPNVKALLGKPLNLQRLWSHLQPLTEPPTAT